ASPSGAAAAAERSSIGCPEASQPCTFSGIIGPAWLGPRRAAPRGPDVSSPQLCGRRALCARKRPPPAPWETPMRPIVDEQHTGATVTQKNGARSSPGHPPRLPRRRTLMALAGRTTCRGSPPRLADPPVASCLEGRRPVPLTTSFERVPS
ncbi:hypothetical protein IscW_ISCW014668, partial [Ixodes scapularis]